MLGGWVVGSEAVLGEPVVLGSDWVAELSVGCGGSWEFARLVVVKLGVGAMVTVRRGESMMGVMSSGRSPYPSVTRGGVVIGGQAVAHGEWAGGGGLARSLPAADPHKAWRGVSKGSQILPS